jgi:hypothetical protein
VRVLHGGNDGTILSTVAYGRIGTGVFHRMDDDGSPAAAAVDRLTSQKPPGYAKKQWSWSVKRIAPMYVSES